MSQYINSCGVSEEQILVLYVVSASTGVSVREMPTVGASWDSILVDVRPCPRLDLTGSARPPPVILTL